MGAARGDHDPIEAETFEDPDSDVRFDTKRTCHSRLLMFAFRGIAVTKIFRQLAIIEPRTTMLIFTY